jgi:hypothetical protein
MLIISEIWASHNDGENIWVFLVLRRDSGCVTVKSSAFFFRVKQSK